MTTTIEKKLEIGYIKVEYAPVADEVKGDFVYYNKKRGLWFEGRFTSDFRGRVEEAWGAPKTSGGGLPSLLFWMSMLACGFAPPRPDSDDDDGDGGQLRPLLPSLGGQRSD
jgi:hypothetical protein